MTRRTASRYARSLYEVVARDGSPQAAGDELAGFAELMSAHPDLGRVLTHPAVPTTRKRALVEDLTSRAGLSPAVSRLLALMADRDRLALVRDVAAAYRERLLVQDEAVRAEVVTAAPLGPERAEALAKGLARATGRKVSIETKVDPGIIGGVIARIGSTVYDGSVARQLERMKARLTGA